MQQSLFRPPPSPFNLLNQFTDFQQNLCRSFIPLLVTPTHYFVLSAAFPYSPKAPVSFVMSVCLYQLGSHWTNFREF